MNCPKCGSSLAPGALFCPVCNEPLPANYTAPQGYPVQNYSYPQGGQPTGGFAPVNGYQQPQGGQPTGGFAPVNGYQQPQPGYGQPSYPQSFSPYGQPGYPGGYQPPYGYGEQRPGGNALWNAVSELPHAFLDSFRSPAEVLKGMLERGDRITGLIVTGVMLLLAFLCGMTVMRAFVGTAFRLVSTLTGVSMAGDATSMNQGISYVAGRIAPSVGAVAALCQLLSMLVPAAVVTVYLTAVCKLRFSFPLLLGLVAVPTFPTVAAALLSMLASLLSPWLAVLCVACGVAVSYVQLAALLGFATGKTDAQLFRPKMICFLISIGVTALLLGLVGGGLMGGVLSRMLQLLTNVGSLI